MPDNIIIRPSDVNDAEGRGFVHYHAWIETYTNHFSASVMRSRSLEKSIEIARKNPENTFVAEVDNTIVGFATHAMSRDEDLAGAGEIMAIYVLKAYQGKGIGRRLMDACIQALDNVDTMFLWVLQANQKTVSFYRSAGFKPDGKTKRMYGQTIIRMVKNCKAT